ncbi:MAG: hypothetical protein EZS28_009177 [Streblomastix strix]|uniref:SPRY domain-containing protein n=1 Tax=Streblomastix strix TaxID=222440 RepID=A0A5J4WK68_9EUKA|nr:MAG: hypothetical protein EZS28_009177 [Streblomastix strix]
MSQVLTPVGSEVLKDIEIVGDTFKHTQQNDNECTLLYNPVINKGIVKLEVQNLQESQMNLCASVEMKFLKKEVGIRSGSIAHIGDRIGGNSGFDDDGSRLGMELNMESNPRTLTFFINDKEQPNFITNIPNAVRIWCYFSSKFASFKINKFELLSTPTARHEKGSRALEYGKEWKK